MWFLDFVCPVTLHVIAPITQLPSMCYTKALFIGWYVL